MCEAANFASFRFCCISWTNVPVYIDSQSIMKYLTCAQKRWTSTTWAQKIKNSEKPEIESVNLILISLLHILLISRNSYVTSSFSSSSLMLSISLSPFHFRLKSTNPMQWTTSTPPTGLRVSCQQSVVGVICGFVPEVKKRWSDG